MEFDDYQQGVIKEKRDLIVKITELETFMNPDVKGSKWNDLNWRDQELVGKQYKLMAEYYHILNERIGRFLK